MEGLIVVAPAPPTGSEANKGQQDPTAMILWAYENSAALHLSARQQVRDFGLTKNAKAHTLRRFTILVVVAALRSNTLSRNQ